MIQNSIKIIEDKINSGTISTSTNISQLNGNTIATNSGTLSSGTQRIAIANDDFNISSIKGNMALMKDTSDFLNACIDQINHHVEVDTNAINGVKWQLILGIIQLELKEYV